jgi:hypothetical protein
MFFPFHYRFESRDGFFLSAIKLKCSSSHEFRLFEVDRGAGFNHFFKAAGGTGIVLFEIVQPAFEI